MAEESDKSFVVPSVPVTIQLSPLQVNVSDTSISINAPPPTIPVFCAPPEPRTQKDGEGTNKGSQSKLGLGLPSNNSLLGADLLQKPASLAMPPPSTATVKKARNLVSPGMSMVKWMKLQEGRVRPPTRRKIPLAEIAKHNSESDCWMVIRNCVYDVTEYIPYHPGGVPELMKGAGKDATALFNEVHRWVNFDSILRSCLQGYLQIEVGESFEETEEDSKLVVARPQTEFSQTETDLLFKVDTQWNDDISDDNWCVSILNRERLLLKVILKPPELWMAHVQLLQSLTEDSVLVNFQNSFKKAVITIKKPSIGPWKQLGLPLENNNRIMDSRNSDPDDYCTGTIIEKKNLTHNVILLGVQTLSSSFIGVPVGFHLKLRLVDGNGPPRKYTPVIKSIFKENDCDSTNVSSSSSVQTLQTPNQENRQKTLYFIIKIYPDGQLTREIGSLQVNSQLELGCVAGRYDPSFFSDCSTLALIAGGSGVTPFIRIVDFLKQRSATYPISRILLIFFNHTEEDIIWRDQWTKFADTWPAFHFCPVVSTPSDTWAGLSGRVDNINLFESILLKSVGEEHDHAQISQSKSDTTNLFGKFKAMTCGSSGFNEAFVTMLKSQSIVKVSATIEDDVFIF